VCVSTGIHAKELSRSSAEIEGIPRVLVRSGARVLRRSHVHVALKFATTCPVFPSKDVDNDDL
jgi:hypothetical protein